MWNIFSTARLCDSLLPRVFRPLADGLAPPWRRTRTAMQPKVLGAGHAAVRDLPTNLRQLPLALLRRVAAPLRQVQPLAPFMRDHPRHRRPIAAPRPRRPIRVALLAACQKHRPTVGGSFSDASIDSQESTAEAGVPDERRVQVQRVYIGDHLPALPIAPLLPLRHDVSHAAVHQQPASVAPRPKIF